MACADRIGQTGPELVSVSKSGDVDLVITLTDKVSGPAKRIAKVLGDLGDDEPSGIHELPEVSSTLDSQDTADLRWFFRTGGLGVFSGSTFGAQLERAALYARRIKRCSRCRGTGFQEGNDEKAERRMRKTTPEERAWMASKRRKIREAVPLGGDSQCRKCLGMGWLPMHRRQKPKASTPDITARPTGSSKRGKVEQSVTIADGDIARLGRVTARLERLAGVSPVHVSVLEAYHGPDFTPAADERRRPSEEPPSFGGLFCVWRFTPAGKTLIRRGGSIATTGEYGLAILANELEAQRSRPDPNRRALLDACQQQAAELYAAACRVWNQVAAR